MQENRMKEPQNAATYVEETQSIGTAMQADRADRGLSLPAAPRGRPRAGRATRRGG